MLSGAPGPGYEPDGSRTRSQILNQTKTFVRNGKFFNSLLSVFNYLDWKSLIILTISLYPDELYPELSCADRLGPAGLGAGGVLRPIRALLRDCTDQ